MVSHVSSVSINFSSVSSPSSFPFPFTPCFGCTIGFRFFFLLFFFSVQSSCERSNNCRWQGSIRFLFGVDSLLGRKQYLQRIPFHRFSKCHESANPRFVEVFNSYYLAERAANIIGHRIRGGREKHVVRKTELGPREMCGYKDLELRIKCTLCDASGKIWTCQ